ncbi:macrophage mannose receptor 1-like [Seriola aureovittata]|uniref:macrophage mannose receptor 1-like n=1 Tax=Seriola aureovittata TaxID=2871759 RepID=UPI0024BE09CD|nr:macrophage mannose receptor 1-like [Seriola aureovittata]
MHYCRKKYTDLATVHSSEDMKRLIAAAGSGYEGEVWIGLRDRQDWRWSLSNTGEPNWRFRKWKIGKPNNSRTRLQLCVSFHQGLWDDDFCTEPLSFVCYNKTNVDLPTTSTDRYIFINQTKTWPQARAYCRLHHTDLTSVRNDTENGLIQQVVPGGQRAWIGLRRDTWRWWRSSRSSFRNWAAGHPLATTGNCAASVINATHLGKWVENHCDQKRHFMCDNNKKQVFEIKLTALKSTVDLNVPNVTEAILNLVKTKMKEKGILKDVKIAWIKKPDKNIFQKRRRTFNIPP